MRIGLGIGLPRGSRKKAPGGSGAPPILLTADLILDSRQGVEAPGTDVTAWLNLGTGGAAINFAGVDPFLQYDAADPLFNAKPSIEQRGDAGLLTNQDLAILDYLSNGSPFTLIGVAYIVPNEASRAILVSAGNSAGTGVHLTVNDAGELQFIVFNGGGIGGSGQVVAAWTPGFHVYAIDFDGVTYRMYIDGAEVDTAPVQQPHGAVRDTVYDIGAAGGGIIPLDGKLSHLSAWSNSIGLAEIQIVTEYLTETFKPLFPAVFLDADLVLDSRIGVQIDGSDDVTDWRNHGQGGTGLDFFGAGTPLMAYDPADALLNGKPSLEQLAGTGALANNNFTTLNYLHDGSEFTMVCCIRAPADSATHRTVIADTSFLSLVSGFNLRFEANSNALIFRVWTTGEDLVIAVSATQTWVPGQILTVSITYDGSDYRLWIDEFLADTPSPPLFPHDADNRTLAVRIGTNEIATEFYGDKLAHISAWDRELNNFERGDARDYLLETFKP